MPEITIEYVPVGELNPADYNPRQIDDSDFSRLKKGLQEFGLVDPLVVNADGTVIGGHQRLKAAQELGIEEVPCVRVAVDKVREKALNVALNKISGEWDYTKLGAVIDDLLEIDFDIELTGFDESEIGALTGYEGMEDGKGLLDIFGEGDGKGRKDTKMVPGKVTIISIGAFIESVDAGQFSNLDELTDLALEIQTRGELNQRQEAAQEIASVALEVLRTWRQNVQK